MKHIKVLSLVLVAAFTFGAVAAGAAQAKAPRWTYTEGGIAKYLEAGQEKEFTANLTGSATLAVPGAGISLDSTECTTTGKIIGSAAGSPGTFTGTLHCTGVTIAGAPNCGVRSEPPTTPTGTITSTQLTGTLVWLKQADDTVSVGVTYKPDPSISNAIAHLEFFNDLGPCALAGAYTLTGTLICTITPTVGHAVEGTKNCPNAAGGGPILKYFTNQTPVRTEDIDEQLKFNGIKATYVAHFVELKLAGNPEWGICPG